MSEPLEAATPLGGEKETAETVEKPFALVPAPEELSEEEGPTSEETDSDNEEVPHKYQPLKEVVYHNNTLLAPDGRVLCRCADKKVQWYLSRGLATVVSGTDKERVIQLKFEPKGNGEAGCEYQLGHKANVCVACGRGDSHTRHHIVEYEYRKHLPESYKSHNSYDICILCGSCHAKYEVHAMLLKKLLATKYDAPLAGKGLYHDKELVQLKKAASALAHHAAVLPADRKAAMLQIVRKYQNKKDGDPDPTVEELEAMGEVETLVRTADFRSHGQAVIQAIADPEDFVQMWRQHFLGHMKPKYLPPTWTVVRKNRREFSPSPDPSTFPSHSPAAATPAAAALSTQPDLPK